ARAEPQVCRPGAHSPYLLADTAHLCCSQMHITSHHITSHHITSHHITSHHITSHHITSHHITSHHITSHHTTGQSNTASLQRMKPRGPPLTQHGAAPCLVY
ncbi:hypothetical protein Vafri_20390, partial [Volvox africanus]